MNGIITVREVGKDRTPTMRIIATAAIHSVKGHPGGKGSRINLIRGHRLEVLESADEIAAELEFWK